PEGVLHLAGSGPYRSDLCIVESALTCAFCSLGSRHPAHDGGKEIIGAAGVPSEDAPQIGQRPVSHDRAARILDVVEQAHDLGALDVLDLARAKLGVDKA